MKQVLQSLVIKTETYTKKEDHHGKCPNNGQKEKYMTESRGDKQKKRCY